MTHPASTSPAAPAGPPVVTAAMVVIGDEILSGRTKDRNVGHLADVLTAIGIDLKEVRIVGDDQQAIVTAVNALRAAYTYVFTTGGIGPTHDDITADAIAAAFGVPVGVDPGAFALLAENYRQRGIDFNPARQRMARFPAGATAIANPVSVAPGFVIGNVHVMAGVPSIFQAMLDQVVPTLRGGARLIAVTVPCPHPEGTIGAALAAIQAGHPETIIGSYPKFAEGRFSTDLVIRARDPDRLEAARAAVAAMVAATV